MKCCNRQLAVMFLYLGGVASAVGCHPQVSAGAADGGKSRPQSVSVVAEKPPTGADQPAGKASASGSRKPNRLANESSPYLLLHAHNPVDWYPWGKEAFDRARREKKPIFLSIGYSSCHWCHVMERLVFSNPKIAAQMNANFINIKVDREVRPDIDDVYMTSLIVYFQAIGSKQGGGWPLSMFLTPEGKPFAGGTYFPPTEDQGRMSFSTVMDKVLGVWEKQPKEVAANAELLARETARSLRPRLTLTPVAVENELVERTIASLMTSFDAEHGGFDFRESDADSAKFPVPAKLALLEYALRKQPRPEIAQALDLTLDRLARGGIHDHLGGGFHRYSTDRRWHVPHFEKMLYDQAQLADVYVLAFERTKNPQYRETAAGIFEFVKRELTGPDGEFFSALDAQTEGREGVFYVWTNPEVERVLGTDASSLFKAAYGLDRPAGFTPGHVLHLPVSLSEIARKQKQSEAEVQKTLSGQRAKLLAAREKRTPLLKDDKVIVGWNGLMVRALARAGRILGEPDYTRRAERAATFLLTKARDSDGRLVRSLRKDKISQRAFLDDYAFLVEGLLVLRETTADGKWLAAARQLMDEQNRLFLDPAAKGYFFSANDAEPLFARTKPAHDAVLPSGNSVSVRNLVRLSGLTGNEQYRKTAGEILELFASSLQASPRGSCYLALGMGEYLEPTSRWKPRQTATSRRDGESTATRPRELATNRAAPRPVPVGRVGRDRNDSPTTAQGEAGQGPLILLAGGEAPAKNKHVIRPNVYLAYDKLPAGGECPVALIVDIDEGWHINSNPAIPKENIPTEFLIKTRFGTKLVNVQYPKGVELGTLGGVKQFGYEKQVVIRGVLEVPANFPGRVEEFELYVKYQPCNSKECLRPTSVKLSGNVSVAKPGEPIKLANPKVFPGVKLP